MSLLYSVIILPIESIVEFVFSFSYVSFPQFGVGGAIIAVSLAINFFALPLYVIADALQMKERSIQNKMASRLSKIKNAFSGSERFMIIQTYYRMNGYHPLYALRSSLSILIEVPFFIAAYHFLSHCPALSNQSILFLKDLSLPDSLLSFSFGNMRLVLNALPLLMTSINCISAYVYTKKAPLKEKIQVYVLAIFFLFLLYNSPSGLVFYWILNNIFSLAKNLIQENKIKLSGKIVHSIFSFVLVAASIYLAFFNPSELSKKEIFLYLITFIVVPLPLVRMVWIKIRNKVSFSLSSNFLLFIISSCLLFVMAGIHLPSNVISSSPYEFSNVCNSSNPNSLICLSSCYFLGLFVFWPLCIYKMFGTKTKFVMERLFFIFALCSFFNAFVFKHDYGTMSTLFRLDNGKAIEHCSFAFLILPLLMFLFLSVLIMFVRKIEKVRVITMILFAFCIAELSIGIRNCLRINSEIRNFDQKKYKALGIDEIEYSLSKTEKNVIVFFLDRAISSFFPYIMEQFPELKTSFSGFVFYPNCLSFGDFTNSGTPAMNGGYEYTIDEINRRNDALLVDKHNESLLVMPTIFSEAGFETVVSDMSYPNYSNFDYSMFDKFEKINAKCLTHKYCYTYKNHHLKDLVNNLSEIDVCLQLKSFVILQMLYPKFRNYYYHRGTYYSVKQVFNGNENNDINERFIEVYSHLFYLPNITDFKCTKPTFTYIGNETTHEFTLLRSDYTPGRIDDNNPPAGTGSYPYRLDPSCGSENDFEGYHVNVAAYLQVGKFLDYLKENDCYDNTRIIIVSDHGRGLPLPCFDGFEFQNDAAFFNPLLMFKDFDSVGEPVTNDSFITNADTVNLARKDLPVSEFNPFTKKKFKSVNDFDSFNVYRIKEWNVGNYSGKKKFPTKNKNAYSVRDNIFNSRNWEKIDTSGDSE